MGVFPILGRVIGCTLTHLDAHTQLSQVTRLLHNRDGTTHQSSHIDSSVILPPEKNVPQL
jgi:hypothetical protein